MAKITCRKASQYRNGSGPDLMACLFFGDLPEPDQQIRKKLIKLRMFLGRFYTIGRCWLEKEIHYDFWK